jgi:hypothetical protein
MTPSLLWFLLTVTWQSTRGVEVEHEWESYVTIPESWPGSECFLSYVSLPQVTQDSTPFLLLHTAFTVEPCGRKGLLRERKSWDSHRESVVQSCSRSSVSTAWLTGQLMTLDPWPSFTLPPPSFTRVDTVKERKSRVLEMESPRAQGARTLSWTLISGSIMCRLLGDQWTEWHMKESGLEEEFIMDS